MHLTPCSDYLEDHIRYDMSSSLLIGVFNKRPSCGVRHCGRFSPDIEKFNI